MDRILVGVDASTSSVAALRTAADEARRHAARLEVVHVFEPHAQVSAFPVLPERGADRADVEAERTKANERLGKWLQEIDVDLDGIKVEWSVIADPRSARALVERSSDADLVVVGARGRGGFKGLRLGSVSEQVVRHANAPVLVVRESTT